MSFVEGESVCAVMAIAGAAIATPSCGRMRRPLQRPTPAPPRRSGPHVFSSGFGGVQSATGSMMSV